MPKVIVLFHYLYPDDINSARHIGDLCTGLASRGWDVLALPCNRGAFQETLRYPRKEVWQGVTFRRVWRLPLRQASTLGRLCNAAWMLATWSLEALRSKPDALIIGTNPFFSVMVARVWRLVHPGVVITHWCYDLYPEAATADGWLRENSLLVKVLKRLLRSAYRSCDLIADIGPCMRERLAPYAHSAMEATLVPWALYEPPSLPKIDMKVRHSLFGDAQLGLMYSGNFGRAHSYEEFLKLARMLRQESIHFAFGVRGHAVKKLTSAITPEDRNITLAPFAAESELHQRLCAPDIHLVSLKPGWEGTVVPSKFFGNLAVGRPVIFAGSRKSSIARWIEEHQVGWVLADDADSMERIALELKQLSQNPHKLRDMQQRCHRVYQTYFTREACIDRWDAELKALIAKKCKDF